MLCELLLFPVLQERLSELEGFSWSAPVRALIRDLATPDADQHQIIIKYSSEYRHLSRLLGIEALADLEADVVQERAERTFTTIKVRLQVRQVDEALQDVIRDLRMTTDNGLEIDELVVRKQQLTRRKRELLGSTLRSLG